MDRLSLSVSGSLEGTLAIAGLGCTAKGLANPALGVLGYSSMGVTIAVETPGVGLPFLPVWDLDFLLDGILVGSMVGSMGTNLLVTASPFLVSSTHCTKTLPSNYLG